jgi:hypothetical protein
MAYGPPVNRRRERLRREIGPFMQAYGRQCRKRNGMDPNDRRYSVELEAELRRLSPEELDRLLRDADDDEV